MVDLKSMTSLFDIINISFGLNGKSIELINKRVVDNIETIYAMKRTKDGLNILNHYCAANPSDTNAHKILDEVAKFERNYGDGTSFLTMFLTYIMNHNSQGLDRESIEKDVDSILKSIDKQVIKERKKVSHIERWVKTICKQDPISESIITFLKENPKSNTSSFKFIDNPAENREVIFLPKRGYFIGCYANRRFVSGAYGGFKNVQITLLDGDLDEETFKEIELRSITEGKRHLILCRNYSNDIDILINECVTRNFMILKYCATEESESEIKADLIHMFNLVHSEEGGKATGTIGEVAVDENGAFFIGASRSYKELESYANAIRENFVGDHIERGAMEYRRRNILSNNTFDIVINSNIYSRQNVIKDMLEDVFRSLPHYDKGLIHGGMAYISTRNRSSKGAIMSIAKEIKHKLLQGSTEKSTIKPIDLLENTKAIFRIIRNFALELIDTHGTPIISKRNWR